MSVELIFPIVICIQVTGTFSRKIKYPPLSWPSLNNRSPPASFMTLPKLSQVKHNRGVRPCIGGGVVRGVIGL